MKWETQTERQQPRDAIQVHIEELILHGFAPGDRYQIASSVEKELTRLMRLASLARLPEKPLAVERINAGAVRVGSRDKPQAAGVQIAQAVYRSLRTGTDAFAAAPGIRQGPGGRKL
jgi:hypothetical protein